MGMLKDRIRVLASSNHFVSVMTAFGFGFKGLLQKKRGSTDHLKSSISLLRRSQTVSGRPMNLTIEPTNVCNLQCPVCETGAGILGRKSGHMSFDDFKKIIDQVAGHTNTLMFYFMGEPFLNKNAYEMIRYAKDSGIPFVETCTNGDFVDAAKLIASGIDQVSFQIGGMSQKTHETYRVKSQLDRVFQNLRASIAEKRKSASSIKINCGLILMKHNEHEVFEFRKTMAEWGVDSAQIVDPCVRNLEQAELFLPSDKKHWIYDSQKLAKGILSPKNQPQNGCPWLYYSLTVHVNGDVVPCCRDPKGEQIVGNLLRQPLDDIWNGDAFKKFREKVLTEQSSIEICRLCSAYPASRIH